MYGVAVDKLNWLYEFTFKTHQLGSDHIQHVASSSSSSSSYLPAAESKTIIQHVAVYEEGAWKVKTDCPRMFVRRPLKLNDRSLYETFEPLMDIVLGIVLDSAAGRDDDDDDDEWVHSNLWRCIIVTSGEWNKLQNV